MVSMLPYILTTIKFKEIKYQIFNFLKKSYCKRNLKPFTVDKIIYILFRY